MAAASVAPSMSTSFLSPVGMSMAPADKYRGAVVEVRWKISRVMQDLLNVMQILNQDLQLPPAFSLPREEAIAAAIELAYDRDFSHIP
jgi:hypothetical protein